MKKYLFIVLLVGGWNCAFQTDFFGRKMNLHSDIISLYNLKRDPIDNDKLYLSFIENGSQTARKYPQKSITLSNYLELIMNMNKYTGYQILYEGNSGTLPLYYDVVIKFQKHNTENTNTTKMSSKNSEIYLNTDGSHWIKEKTSNGAIITLEDGSVWDIAGVDRVLTLIWLPTEEIMVNVESSPIGDYKYLLYNTNLGEKVNAKFIGMR